MDSLRKIVLNMSDAYKQKLLKELEKSLPKGMLVFDQVSSLYI